MLSVRVYIILDLVRCVGVNLEPFQPEDWKAGIIDGKARQCSSFLADLKGVWVRIKLVD